MIIDLTEQNKILAAVCRQADANAMIGVLKRCWSVNGLRPRRGRWDEDEIFLASKYDCCMTNPSVLITEREGYSKKVNGKYVVAS